MNWVQKALTTTLAAVPLWTASLHAAEPLPFQRGTWDTLRQAHQGRPWVVHFWGLTCGPCLVELPAWARLARERPGVAIAIVAADPAPARPGAVSMALSKAGLAGAESWVFEGFAQRLRFEVDPAWQGELPLTMLVGKDGSVQSIVGVADLARVRAWLDGQTRTP